MESVPPFVVWLVVAIVLTMMRLLWPNLLWVLGFALVTSLLIFVPSLAQYRVVSYRSIGTSS
jgi:membrane protein implicated in regulation of membrane protease activity